MRLPLCLSMLFFSVPGILIDLFVHIRAFLSQVHFRTVFVPSSVKYLCFRYVQINVLSVKICSTMNIPVVAYDRIFKDIM